MKKNDIDDVTPYERRKTNNALRNKNRRAIKASANIDKIVDENKTEKVEKDDSSITRSSIEKIVEDIVNENKKSSKESKLHIEPAAIIKKIEDSIPKRESLNSSSTSDNSNSSSNKEVHIKKVKEERPKTTKSIKVLATITSIVAGLGIIACFGALVFAGKLLEDKPEFDRAKLESEDSSVIYDANGDEIVELGLYLRENVEYDDLPNCLVDAFLSIEDSRYFEHFGFDIPRFTKANLPT